MNPYLSRVSSVGTVARSAAVSSIPDAILVSASMGGAEPRIASRRGAEAVDPDAPLIVNTGTKSSNIAAFLDVADGCIVGTDLKVDG